MDLRVLGNHAVDYIDYLEVNVYENTLNGFREDFLSLAKLDVITKRYGYPG